MALSEPVLAVIVRVTPEELAETRRWCELGDRVHLLSDLTEGRNTAEGEASGQRARKRRTHKGAAKLKEGKTNP